MVTLTPGQARLFLEPNFGFLGTYRRDGTTQLTPVWVDWDGEHVLVNTTVGRVKERHMRRDPRVSIAVMDRNEFRKYVSVNGSVELTEDGAEDHIDKLANKYLGLPRYRVEARAADERRVLVRITPTRVSHWNIED